MTRDIVINGRFLSRRVTGVERYGGEILRYIGNNSRVEKPALSLVETTRLNGVAGHAWEQFILPTKLNQHSILWSPANTGPLMVRNQVLTVHDLSPLEHPEWFQPGFAAWYRLFLPTLIKRVKRMIVSSEYTKQKIMMRFGVKDVLVAPAGVDTNIFHPDVRQDRYEFPQEYILFVGSLQLRKNLQLLLKTWNEIKNDFADTWLVVAGDSGRIFNNIKFVAYERVRFLGYVADADLPGLYANAKLFVLPSLDEGFGLPALEAMACGTPVIVSDGGALPETVGDAAMIFNLNTLGSDGLPSDRLGIAIKECLSNSNLHSSLKEKGLARAKIFSWQTTADLIWKNLNEMQPRL